MKDIGDLASAAGMRHDFPHFGTSAAQRIAETLKSPLTAADVVARSIRESVGAAGKFGLNGSLADQEIRNALGGSLSEYRKSRDHMHDVFGAGSLADKAAGMAIQPTASSEIERYMAELEGPSQYRSVTPDLPDLYIPPNPIKETNEHLAGVSKKFDALVDLSAKQADVINKLLEVQISNSAAQEKATKRTNLLSVVSAALATVLGIGAIIVTIVVAG
ncbi:MAG TPA: hypothetical protein VGB79_15410 [Allosphingosinicella sp.]|jgi:hypothetical protein